MNHNPARSVAAETADAFFSQVESLEADYVRSAQRSRQVAWWVAAAFGAMAVLEGVAIASLAPIHTVEWRLVRVDSSTGVVDEVNQLRAAPKTVDEANARYYLAQYVRLREGYAAPETEYNFRSVSLMSTPDEQQRYNADFKGSNPLSPQVVFGKGGYIQIQVESVSVLGPKLGQVRFSREEEKDGGRPKVTQWIATIGFEWHPDALISNADRTINPLGFQVADYHIDAVVRQ
jgi:type IV secretion system protein VirB8